MYVQLDKSSIDDYLGHYYVLACRLRNSRLKAKRIAIMELFMAMLPYESIFLANGPLSNIKGLICYLIPRSSVSTIRDVLQKIGYCEAFYILNFDEDIDEANDIASAVDQVWKGRRFAVQKILGQDRNIYDSQSPHNKMFAMATGNVRGYRGDGSALGRRALPVEDCRCLVNLANPSSMGTMIDPFAGAGGIICAVRFINGSIRATTIDIDPILAIGLEEYGATHHVGDASQIFLNEKFDAIITELPFALDVTILKGLKNICGYLEAKGSVSVMCAPHQFNDIRKFVRDMGMYVYCEYQVNRKGIDVAIIAATLCKSLPARMSSLVERIATIS